MAAVELTRMDFHVVRFMESEDVEEMDSSEVGQFCLLLFKAWLIAKDVSLPVSEEKLARYARVERIAEIVLKQFPIVDTQWGPRRRNGVQLEAWQAAKARSEAGKAGAANRWGKQWEGKSDSEEENKNATALAEPSNRKAGGLLIALPNPDQAVPDQSNQSNRTSNTDGDDAFSSQPSTENKGGDWSEIRRIHSRIFGKKPNKALFAHKYEAACREHGEAIVLACFDEWAQSARDWVKREAIDNPMHAFMKKLSDLAADEKETRAEATQLAVEEKAAQNKRKLDADAIEQSILQQQQKDWERMNAAPPPENGGSVLDYLAELESTQNGT